MWVHLFTRDLRLEDNTSLNWLATQGHSVLPVFVFTPEQVVRNPVKSSNSIQFMLKSLSELDNDLKAKGSKLHCFYGKTVDVLKELKNSHKISGISLIMDYTPYAKTRLSKIQKLGVPVQACHDIYLTEPGTVLNKAGKMFQKFTFFHESAERKTVAKPETRKVKFETIRDSDLVTVPFMEKKLVPDPNPNIHVKGGRAEAMGLLKDLKTLDYDTNRDLASKPTSNLSAHNHFGTVSIREVFHSNTNPEFRRQLYWRDFYGHIVHAFDDLYGVNAYEFMEKPSGHWKDDKVAFRRWCTAKTGVELVDAGIRQLLETGYMHNRVRLVVSSYLVKDLKIYWRWGERFFAQHLVDYDFSQNFGNWCWVSSVLPFSQAPFRRIDAERQIVKIDPDGSYRKRWLA